MSQPQSKIKTLLANIGKLYSKYHTAIFVAVLFILGWSVLSIFRPHPPTIPDNHTELNKVLEQQKKEIQLLQRKQDTLIDLQVQFLEELEGSYKAIQEDLTQTNNQLTNIKKEYGKNNSAILSLDGAGIKRAFAALGRPATDTGAR